MFPFKAKVRFESWNIINNHGGKQNISTKKLIKIAYMRSLKQSIASYLFSDMHWIYRNEFYKMDGDWNIANECTLQHEKVSWRQNVRSKKTEYTDFHLIGFICEFQPLFLQHWHVIALMIKVSLIFPVIKFLMMFDSYARIIK